jgi:hypothetical protein
MSVRRLKEMQHSSVFIPFLNAISGAHGPHVPPLNREGGYFPTQSGGDGRAEWASLVHAARRSLPADVRRQLQRELDSAPGGSFYISENAEAPRGHGQEWYIDQIQVRGASAQRGGLHPP